MKVLPSFPEFQSFLLSPDDSLSMKEKKDGNGDDAFRPNSSLS